MNKAGQIPKPTQAAGLLRREPREAFRRGAHLRLADLADGGVTRFLSAEAAPVYLTLLYALLLFRRRHELDPLHNVLYDEIRPVVESQMGGSYSLDAFASDVNQLVEWGCLKREVEAARIRGYRDRSRDHFRYTLTSDTVSFLEWLESRLDHRVHGTLQDGRDLLLDLTQRLNEAAKIVRRLRDLELRNFRLEEIGARLKEMAALDENDPRPGLFLRRLMALVHVPLDPNLESEGKARLPLVRVFREWTDRGAPEFLRRPTARPEDALVQDEDRRARLRAYVHNTLLRGAWSGRLSNARLESGENPFEWLAVAKAGFLSQGRDLDRAGVHIQDEAGSARLSADGRHVATVDHTLVVMETHRSHGT